MRIDFTSASKMQPTLKVIFATGAADSVLEDASNPTVLRKPYSEEDIVIALKRAGADR